MKKKLIAGILSAGMVLSCAQALPQGVNVLSEIGVMRAAALEENGFTYTVSGSSATITKYKYTWTDSTFTIPSTIGGYPVTTVGGDGALVTSTKKGGAVTKIVIPEGVTKIIGKNTFRYFENTESISFPSTLTEIGGENVFADYQKLTSITLPNGLIKIGTYSFGNCQNLTSITIPSSVTTIGERAFENCSSLKEVTVPKTVTSIGSRAFGFDDEKVIEGFVFKCYSNTEASEYAEKNLPDNYILLDSTHKHTWNNGVVTTQPTCTKKGITTYTCTGCNKTKTEENVPALGHDYSVVVEVVAPTETEWGYTVYKCSRCTETRTTDYVSKVTKGDLANAEVSGISSSYTYTGKAISPAPTVKIDGTTLKMGTDYTATYANNTNAGTASITLQGIGNYTGTKYLSFQITGGAFDSAAVTGISSSYEYTGSAIAPVPTVKIGSTTLASGTDYTVSYKNNTNVGTATVTITGKGNYSGGKSITFKITAKSISGATVSGVSANYEYTGAAIKPTPTVTLSGKTLSLNSEYNVAYSSNINAGTATVTVNGIGNYTGSKSVTFKITAKSIAGASVSGIADSYNYTGAAIKPTPTVTLGGKTLSLGSEYNVAYSSNINAGTATVTVNGIGNYTGSKSVTFKITAKSIAGASVSGIADSYNYTGAAIKPTPTVTLSGKTLTSGTDYTVSYSNNTNAGTATVAIVGKGNYTGTVTKIFTIKKAAVSGAATGDADRNGSVDVSDVLIIQQDIAGWTTSIDKDNADVDGDGVITVQDGLLIQQKIAGWDVTFK